MSSKQKSITLTDEHARTGKIANNLECHGDEKMPAFTVPFTSMLTFEQLDRLMGKYFHRALFNQDKTGLWQPVDGFRRCKALQLTDHYEKAAVAITVPESAMEFKDCKIEKLSLEPQTGGLTELKGQIYLRPGIGRENLLLQEYQEREVTLRIDGKLAAKKNPQQDNLPFGSPGEKASEAGQRMLDRAAAMKGKCHVCKNVATVQGICPQCFWHSGENRDATSEEIVAAGLNPLNGSDDRKPPKHAPNPNETAH